VNISSQTDKGAPWDIAWLGALRTRRTTNRYIGEEKMYQISELITNIDAHMTPLLIYGTIANLLAYVQMLYGAWIGFRDRSHAVPLAANTLFLAHDSYYVYNHDYWFNTINHPFFIGNWYAMAIFVCIELTIAWQIITYSRNEVGLGNTWFKAFISYVAIQVGMYILFLWLRSMIDDPLYVICFALSVVVANIFNIPMLLNRGNRKGQSLWIAGAITIQTGPVVFFLVNPLLTKAFLSPIWVLAGLTNTVLAAVYFVMLWKAPPYKVATEPH